MHSKRIEDAILVTNTLLTPIPQEGICIPYYVACHASKLPAYKRIIAEIWEKNAAEGMTVEAIAGAVRATITLERLAEEGIRYDIRHDGLPQGTCDRAYDAGFNPVRFMPHYPPSLALWGTWIWNDGKRIQPAAPTNTLNGVTIASCDAARKYGVIFQHEQH